MIRRYVEKIARNREAAIFALAWIILEAFFSYFAIFQSYLQFSSVVFAAISAVIIIIGWMFQAFSALVLISFMLTLISERNSISIFVRLAVVMLSFSVLSSYWFQYSSIKDYLFYKSLSSEYNELIHSSKLFDFSELEYGSPVERDYDALLVSKKVRPSEAFKPLYFLKKGDTEKLYKRFLLKAKDSKRKPTEQELKILDKLKFSVKQKHSEMKRMKWISFISFFIFAISLFDLLITEEDLGETRVAESSTNEEEEVLEPREKEVEHSETEINFSSFFRKISISK